MSSSTRCLRPRGEARPGSRVRRESQTSRLPQAQRPRLTGSPASSPVDERKPRISTRTGRAECRSSRAATTVSNDRVGRDAVPPGRYPDCADNIVCQNPLRLHVSCDRPLQLRFCCIVKRSKKITPRQGVEANLRKVIFIYRGQETFSRNLRAVLAARRGVARARDGDLWRRTVRWIWRSSRRNLLAGPRISA